MLPSQSLPNVVMSELIRVDLSRYFRPTFRLRLQVFFRHLDTPPAPGAVEGLLFFVDVPNSLCVLSGTTPCR